MILDNLDDYSLLQPSTDQKDASTRAVATYIPKAQSGRLLITTRDRRVGEALSSPAKTIDVCFPSMEEALQMMNSRMAASRLGPHAEGKSEELARSLGFVPLAMMQAAAYIIETGDSIEQYLEYAMMTHGDFEYLLELDYFDQRRDADGTSSVYKTWKISFECIQRQNQHAADLLALMSVLDRQSVPVALLRKQIFGNVPFNLALSLLIKFRLIEKQQETDLLSMHRLIHLCMQAWVRLKGTHMGWQERALKIVDEEFPCAGTRTRAQCEKLLPHATLLINSELADKASRLRITSLHSKCGEYLLEIGSFKAAIPHLEVAHSTSRELLGNSHHVTLESLQRLSENLRLDGQYERAEQLILQVIDGWHRNLDDENQSMMRAKASLAAIYHQQGNYNNANELLQLVVKTSQQSLGAANPVGKSFYRRRGGDSCLIKHCCHATSMQATLARENRQVPSQPTKS